jgi:hypothetical protein
MGPGGASERLANRGRLVDAKVVGDDLHVQEPKDEQRESDHADECEHNQDEAIRFGYCPASARPRPGKGAGELGEDREDGVRPDPIQPTDAER